MNREPTLEEWGWLYQSAVAVKELAPWEWMGEIDLFGIENPETGELGFVSVMGMLGEHYCVALYLGAEGLRGFREVSMAGGAGVPEDIFDARQLQASFEDREFVEKDDRRVMRALGLRFRGRGEWPVFRSYSPGFAPWGVDADEARFLTHALRQTLDVAPRFRDDPLLLDVGAEGDALYLFRVPHKHGESFVWKDETRHVPPPPPKKLSIDVDTNVMDRIRQLPQARSSFEVDCTTINTLIGGEEGTRPFMPRLLLIVDRESGFILDLQLLLADPSVEAMWAQVPGLVLSCLAGLEQRPRRVLVRARKVYDVLRPALVEVGIKVQRVLWLDAVAEVRESLEERMLRGDPFED